MGKFKDMMIETEGEDNTERFIRLKYEVKYRFDKRKSIMQIKDEVLRTTGFRWDDVLRREYDGVTQIDWLIEKMIGELLSENKIKN